jgi:hypothetical protein
MRLTAEDYQKIDRILQHYEDKVDRSVRIPNEEYDRRYEKVWAEMEKLGIDLGFYYWYREFPGDGIYLTAYNPTLERASGVIAPAKNRCCGRPESGCSTRRPGSASRVRFVEEFTIPGSIMKA